MVRQTSIKTYQQLLEEGIIGRNQQRVLKAIIRFPKCTDRELAVKIMARDPNVVRPRRKELLDARIIIDAGVRKCKISNRNAHTWRLATFPIRIPNLKKVYCQNCQGKGFFLEATK